MLIYLSDYFSSLLWFVEIAFMQNRNRKIEDEITQGTQTITWLGLRPMPMGSVNEKVSLIK